MLVAHTTLCWWIIRGATLRLTGWAPPVYQFTNIVSVGDSGGWKDNWGTRLSQFSLNESFIPKHFFLQEFDIDGIVSLALYPMRTSIQPHRGAAFLYERASHQDEVQVLQQRWWWRFPASYPPVNETWVFLWVISLSLSLISISSGPSRCRAEICRQHIKSEQRRRDELREGYHCLKDSLPVSNQKSSKVKVSAQS